MALKFPQQDVNVYVPSPTPSIESDRLLLRPVVDSDDAALFAIRKRPEVSQFNHPKTPFKSIEETRDWMESKIFKTGPSDVIDRSFFFAILDKSISPHETQLIGYVSINFVDPFPEIGYGILPEAWGKGYATEALGLMLQLWWGLQRRAETVNSDAGDGVERVYAITERQNLASCQVLRKCGFCIIDEPVYGEDKLYIWALQRPT